MPATRASKILFALILGCVSLVAQRAGHATLVRGQIILHGSKKTSVAYVESRIGLGEGAPITFERLKFGEERLIASDLFSKAEVTIDLPPAQAAQLMYVDKKVYVVDVDVTLEEKLSWIIFPNASFGSGDKALGAIYAEQNLGGRGFQLIAAAQYGQQNSFVAVGFREPLISATAPLTYTFSAVYRRENFRFFDQHRSVQSIDTMVAGGEAQLGWVYSSRFRALVGALYHRQTLGEMITTLQPPVPFNSREGNIVTLQLQMLYDSTVAPEGLRRGALVSLRNEISDAFWKSDFDYFKIDVGLHLYGYFHKTYPSAIFRIALVYPTSDRGVPLTEILRAGGPDLRGYLANEFHGDTLVTVQLEEAMFLLRFKRVNFAGAVFADAGALLERHPGGVATQSTIISSSPRLGDFHTSLGAGLRVLIPGVAIPAVKLDFGYGFDVDDTALIFSVARGAL